MICWKNRLKNQRGGLLLFLLSLVTGILVGGVVESASAAEIEGEPVHGEKEGTPLSMRCPSGNAWFGPLHLRGQSAFQLLRLSLLPVGAEFVPKGHFLVSATATWTNRWAWKEGKYLIDGEILRLATAATYGVTNWMQLRIELPFCLRAGGFMDGFIQGFHDAFGLGQAGRKEFPKDQFRIIFWRKDGTRFELKDSAEGAGLEDMVLSAKFLLMRGGKWLPQTCLTLHLKLPTGNEKDLYGSGSLDGGFALCFAKKIWKLYGYFGFQYTRFGGDRIAGIEMRQDQFSFLSAMELPVSTRWSLVVQELFNTGAAADFYEFSDATNEITFGAKAEITENTLLELGLIENLFKFDNSPDFGVHCGITRRF